jgi:hypothetical protein
MTAGTSARRQAMSNATTDLPRNPHLAAMAISIPRTPAVCRSFGESSIVHFVYGHNQTKLISNRHIIGAGQLA